MKRRQKIVPPSSRLVDPPAPSGGKMRDVSDDTHAFLQWKNTDACIDLFCACGEQFHFDGYFATELTCGKCGQTWELPHSLPITPVEPARPLTIVFDGQDVIRDGEFDFTWPRASFEGVKPGGSQTFEIHDEVVPGWARSVYVDFIRATPRGDGTMTVTVRNRGTSP